jgi:hypothetical protein
MTEIIVKHRAGNYRAHIKDSTEIFGFGRTAQEAIGSLIMWNPEYFPEIKFNIED